MTTPALTRAAGFVLGWTVELIVLPFGVFTLALIYAALGAYLYLSDVGFIARNIGDLADRDK